MPSALPTLSAPALGAAELGAAELGAATAAAPPQKQLHMHLHQHLRLHLPPLLKPQLPQPPQLLELLKPKNWAPEPGQPQQWPTK